jgi:hypothetical protein
MRTLTSFLGVLLLADVSVSAFTPLASKVAVGHIKITTRPRTFLTARIQQQEPITHRYPETRRAILQCTLALIMLPIPALAKCTDLETCREIGERKVEKDLVENPVTTTKSGSRYKLLQPGTGEAIVDDNSTLDLIYSISTSSGGYMYSQGFGFEKVDAGNGKMMSDAGLDSVRVKIGDRNVPLGIEDALIGMKKGERRRVEVPPNVGFTTSDWKPEPVSKRGKAGIIGYRRIVEGNGPNQPAFPAATIWDIEVLRIRK